MTRCSSIAIFNENRRLVNSSMPCAPGIPGGAAAEACLLMRADADARRR
jgi:hypothetical protein